MMLAFAPPKDLKCRNCGPNAWIDGAAGPARLASCQATLKCDKCQQFAFAYGETEQKATQKAVDGWRKANP